MGLFSASIPWHIVNSITGGGIISEQRGTVLRVQAQTGLLCSVPFLKFV